MQGNTNAFLVLPVIESETEAIAKFTIFAPNDAAFNASFPEGIDDSDVFYGVGLCRASVCELKLCHRSLVPNL